MVGHLLFQTLKQPAFGMLLSAKSLFISIYQDLSCDVYSHHPVDREGPLQRFFFFPVIFLFLFKGIFCSCVAVIWLQCWKERHPSSATPQNEIGLQQADGPCNGRCSRRSCAIFAGMLSPGEHATHKKEIFVLSKCYLKFPPGNIIFKPSLSSKTQPFTNLTPYLNLIMLIAGEKCNEWVLLSDMVVNRNSL